MEECDDIETGDLGLGKGLKPGAIEKERDEDSNLKFTMLVHTPAGVRSRTSTSSVTSADHDVANSKLTSKLSDKLKWLKRRQSTRDSKDRGYDYDFPPYTEVPIGTSLSQQRHLFDQELQELMKKNGITDAEGLFGPRRDSMEDYKNLDKAAAEKKLHCVEQEAIILKHDLELCQSQLDTKYKAIKILQSQAYATQNEQMLTNHKVKIQNRQMQEEINNLQFQLDHQQTRLMDSQQGWLDKFDRVCQENTALMATVEAQAEEMRKLNAYKLGLEREREELLALLDIQDRQRFESVHSPTSTSHCDDTYYNFSSMQFAVLGSCHCRTNSPEPCGCALKAAQLQKELATAKDDLQKQKQKWRESMIVLDTYRMAFEEQLARNRGLIRKIAQLTSLPRHRGGRVDKARAAIKWVIKQLNDVNLHVYTGKLEPYPLILGSTVPCEEDLPTTERQTVKAKPPSQLSFNSISHRKKQQPTLSQQSCPQSLKQPTNNATDRDSAKYQPAIITPTDNSQYISSRDENVESEKGSNGLLDHLSPADEDQRASSPGWEQISLPSSENEETEKTEGEKARIKEMGWSDTELESKSEQDLIDMLLDTIYDKTEALLHQRLITRMLAEKTRELEGAITRLTDPEDVFLPTLNEKEDIEEEEL